jgi:hypothetical protein
MKTLDDAVIELNGIWPEGAEVLLTTGDEWCGDVEFYGRIIAGDKPYSDYGYAFMDRSIQGYAIIGSSAWIVLCRMNEFQQRAKELGFINGYRWGVKHKSDGKKPDLPDDVVIGIDESDYPANTVDSWVWSKVKLFMITDERYKPVDTSYLEKPALEPVPEEESWWSDDMHKAVSPAPVGAKIIVDCFGVGCKDAVVIGAFDRWNWVDIGGVGLETVDLCRIKPADHADRKAKAERKKVVDAAVDLIEEKGLSLHCIFGKLYDKGFLKLPE